MGCGSSKVADTGAVPVGYGMGTSPAYTGIRSTSKKPVLVAWDMDDVICPSDNSSCVQFLNILHEVFVAKHGRVESRIVAVYDSRRELNMSRAATDLRLFLETENVELKSSDGPTVTTVDQVVMDFATTMPRGSTIVIIGNVTEYHEACLYARKKGLFVERILSADGLHRLAEACHANWMCSLANFLEAHGMADWRRPAGRSLRSSSISFRSTSTVTPGSAAAKGLLASAIEEQPPQQDEGNCKSQTEQVQNAASPEQAPAQTSEAVDTSGARPTATDVTADIECQVADSSLSIDIDQTTIGLPADLDEEVVNLAVDTALNNMTEMVAVDMASAPGDSRKSASEASECQAQGFDNIAERAVRVSMFAGAEEDVADIARKSERVVRPSMAVSMFRGRRHIAATIDPDAASDDEDPMDIVPMLSVTAQEESQPEVQDIALGPDPVLRALRTAEDSAMTVCSLAALAPNPVVGTPYADHLNEHLINRDLAKWVVEKESIQLIV